MNLPLQAALLKLIKNTSFPGTLHHLSHTDLDGVGCQVVAERGATSSLGDSDHFAYRRHNADYSELDETIEAITSTMSAEDTLLISDLSIRNTDTVALLEGLGEGRVVVVDHHASSLPFVEGREAWFFVDTSRSATLMLAEAFFDDRFGGIPGKVLEFARLVSDYDLWIHSDARSERLNMLLHGLGVDEFFNRFFDHINVQELHGEELLIDALLRMRQEYVDEAMKSALITKDLDGNPFALIYAEQHPSLLGSEMLKSHPEIKYVKMINMQRKTVSLRSRSNEFNVAELAERYGGGGHPAAAGHPLPSPSDLTYAPRDEVMKAGKDLMDLNKELMDMLGDEGGE